jgi:hypothetical protein
MRLEQIVWPVFRLSEKTPTQSDGSVFFYNEYVDSDDSTASSVSIKVVDDRSLPQATLGLRRLALKQDPNVKLYPISVAIYFLGDLIKLAKATTWFIDSSGAVFQHKKFTRAKLVTKKIKQVLPAAGLGCVLELEGISQRFKSLQHPQDFHEYATVLYLNKIYILYGLSESPRKDSWRLI